MRTVLVRVALGLLTILALLGIAGASFQALATWRDRRAFPPPGRLLSVGGTTWHLHCTGAGAPTVVLEAGAGSSSSQWGWVQPELSTTSRVCSYDRAGMGWSAPTTMPRDAQQIATELAALLDAGGERGPFVLVGHSAGGLYSRAFADLFPDQVAGLVLLDPMDPQQFAALPGTFEAMRLPGVFVPLAYLGVNRLLSGMTPAVALPEADRAAFVAQRNTAHFIAATRAEIEAFPTVLAQVGAMGGVANRPLTVISASDTVAAYPALGQLHEQAVALSTRGRYEVVPDAQHFSLVAEREHATPVVAAIRQVVEQVR